MTDARPLLDGEDRVMITDGAARRVLGSIWGGTDWRAAPEAEVDAAWKRSDRPFHYVINVLAALAPSVGLSEHVHAGHIPIEDALGNVELRVAGSARAIILVGTREEPLEEILALAPVIRDNA
jgi:hypothetical protein